MASWHPPRYVLGKVGDLDTARSGALSGVLAALVNVVLALAGPRFTGSDNPPVLLAVCYLLIAAAIWRMSRTAAVFGFLLALVYVWAFARMVGTMPGRGVAGMVTVLLVALAYWSAVRGTFAYHRLRAASPAPA